MAGDMKVGHIVKGISDDASHLLVISDCQTVTDVITDCRRFQEAKSHHITHNFTMLPNTAPTSSCEAIPTTHQSTTDEVTKSVCRELEAMMAIAN